MTGPTPEERAADIAEWGVLWPGRAKMEERITAEIRAAIEADRREHDDVAYNCLAQIATWVDDYDHEEADHRPHIVAMGIAATVENARLRIAQLEAQLRDTEQQVLASHQANRELEKKLRERTDERDGVCDALERVKAASHELVADLRNQNSERADMIEAASMAGVHWVQEFEAHDKPIWRVWVEESSE